VVENNKHLHIPKLMNDFLAHVNIQYRNHVINCKGTLEDGKEFVARAYLFGAGIKISNMLLTLLSFSFMVFQSY